MVDSGQGADVEHASLTRSGFLPGLFFITFAGLTLEIADTRLLSVLTWYHLSFFAVSVAMFGMAAGAVRVYLAGPDVEGDAARLALAEYSTLLAISIPCLHVVSLCIPIPDGINTPAIVSIFVLTLILSVPFYLMGVVVAIALTRIPGPSGLVYSVDLVGAALGSAGVLLLFRYSNIVSAVFTIGAVAALGAACFHRFARTGRVGRNLLLCVCLLIVALVNEVSDYGLGTMYAKGRYHDPSRVFYEDWTVHGQVMVQKSFRAEPFYWAKAEGRSYPPVVQRSMVIDGSAGTTMTGWKGDDRELAWTQADVTSLPYHIRKGGNNAVIGVGGGRDLLTALWANSQSVTGIEINEAFIYLHQDLLRDFSGLANDPRVRFVHDEARSYLTRTDERYDVLQMSLIDTWAATGAGAFTLSENGLYTVESWKTFLRSLRPGGIFSVSRWYNRKFASETSRLVSLATAALLESGVESPRKHMILAARGAVATLLVSSWPFTQEDITALLRAEESMGLEVLLAPGRKSSVPLIDRIAGSRSLAEIDQVVAGLPYDYSPPTDERPYFFNILKPGADILEELRRRKGGVVSAGNMVATLTLGVLWMVTLVLVVVTILGPLARSGLPQMKASSFALAVTYFVLIGLGFMFVQIPLMQRFSVYLGHPTYSLAVILFSMILATGVGSFVSDRLDVESRAMWTRIIPIVIAVNLLGWTLTIQPMIDATIHLGLGARVLLTTLVVGMAALPLGLCFPVGLRLVQQISADATPWMWGVNGAAGVLASVTAVGISMWLGISTSLYVATAAYALLLLPSTLLWRRGRPG